MRLSSFAGLAAVLLFTHPAAAETYTIHVATRESPASAKGEALANGTTSFYFAKLPKALSKAAELLNGKTDTVRVLVAGARAADQSQRGTFSLAGINSPGGTLQLLGGWSDDFTARDPFKHPTQVIVGEGRNAGIFAFDRKTAIGNLVISGFIMDAAPSNKYDAKTNSLLKGTSSTTPLLQLSQVGVQKLVVADNVFINSAHRAFEVYVSALSPTSEVEITNNFFLNNVIPLKFEPARGKNKLKRITFRQNSVILNWPFNPDPTSSNVGAIELWTNEAVAEVRIEGNLFAHNPGGAIQHDWQTNRSPKVAITGNLFFMNATLFGDATPDAGLFTGKFGAGPKHRVVKVKGAEDDFDYDLSGNVSLDPKVPVALVEPGFVDSSGVTAKKTAINDVRGMFGLNKDGGTVAIKNFAPRMGLDLDRLPFPEETAAKKYGVQREGLWKP